VVELPASFQISLDRIEHVGYIDAEPSASGKLRAVGAQRHDTRIVFFDLPPC
jgi:hypothetical protein